MILKNLSGVNILTQLFFLKKRYDERVKKQYKTSLCILYSSLGHFNITQSKHVMLVNKRSCLLHAAGEIHLSWRYSHKVNLRTGCTSYIKTISLETKQLLRSGKSGGKDSVYIMIISHLLFCSKSLV